jgi:hypothetical protein
VHVPVCDVMKRRIEPILLLGSKKDEEVLLRKKNEMYHLNVKDENPVLEHTDKVLECSDVAKNTIIQKTKKNKNKCVVRTNKSR